jgi:DMSO reductase family type II enzyme chaperone
MATKTLDRRAEKAARRALARSDVYRLLSEALAYPTADSMAARRDHDLLHAQQASSLPERVAALLAALAEHTRDADTSHLQSQHRRIFSHVVSTDCPPCETLYTARHVFQETADLSDIAGFYRAFGLQLAEKERPDHITVELEFMHFLTYKEAYAFSHHGPAKARLCREAERKFVRDHLGRWGTRFAQRLAQKAGGGYYGCVASLLETYLPTELDFLRVEPEVTPVERKWSKPGPDDFNCPFAEGGT